MDYTALLLLVLAGLGIFSGNSSVTLAMVVLLLLRVMNLQHTFPWLEKYGLTVGIVLLTIGVMTPLASGRITVQEVFTSFLHWRSLLAIAVGILVAYLGGRGVTLMTSQPTIVNGILIGTVLGVAFFKGVPVGPLIAAGILSLLIGKY